MSACLPEIPNVYKIAYPERQTVPLVFDSPHSGEFYPNDYNYSCDLTLLRQTEDRFIDEIYAGVTKIGAPLLSAQFARNYIDVNRAEDEIDPDLLEADWPNPYSPSVRASAGHGVVHRLIRAGSPIYTRRLSVAEVQNRIDCYYRPYHAALKHLLDRTYEIFGEVFYIDCHSMNSPNAPEGSAFSRGQADFVLGDRDGTTCNPKFTRSIRDFLVDLGYKVYINEPYKGVELLKRYSDPLRSRHSLQIEINKSLYLNEKTQEKNKNFNSLKEDIEKLSGFMAQLVSRDSQPEEKQAYALSAQP